MTSWHGLLTVIAMHEATRLPRDVRIRLVYQGILTLEDCLRTMDAALELLQARLQFQLDEVLVRLRALQKERP